MNTVSIEALLEAPKHAGFITRQRSTSAFRHIAQANNREDIKIIPLNSLTGANDTITTGRRFWVVDPDIMPLDAAQTKLINEANRRHAILAAYGDRRKKPRDTDTNSQESPPGA